MSNRFDSIQDETEDVLAAAASAWRSKVRESGFDPHEAMAVLALHIGAALADMAVELGILTTTNPKAVVDLVQLGWDTQYPAEVFGK